MSKLVLSSEKLASKSYKIIPFTTQYHDQVETLLDDAFGLDRKSKSSYQMREKCERIDSLCKLIVNEEDEVLATISYWQFDLLDHKGLLLGPLAVSPKLQGTGLGKKLMFETIKLAKSMANEANWKIILLVGDLDYYQKMDFKMVPLGAIDYPKPVDLNRLLYLNLSTDMLDHLIEGADLPINLVD